MPTTRRLDLYREHASEYRTTRKPALVTIKPAAYLSIRGAGTPGDEQFRVQVGALYGVASTMRSTCRIRGVRRPRDCARSSGIRCAAREERGTDA